MAEMINGQWKHRRPKPLKWVGVVYCMVSDADWTQETLSATVSEAMHKSKCLVAAADLVACSNGKPAATYGFLGQGQITISHNLILLLQLTRLAPNYHAPSRKVSLVLIQR
jgi:hypothetical protein